jgi:DNA-binding NarL/FixJ family response regulator
MITSQNLNLIQVLLVEENTADANLMQRVFARTSPSIWQLVHVEQLEEAINLYAEYAELTQGDRSFDVLLLDLEPFENCEIDMIQRCREVLPNVALVVLSKDYNDDLALQAIAAGAQDYLIKEHTTLNQLMRSIRYAVERERLLRRTV